MEENRMGIGGLDHESIKPGSLEADGAPKIWSPMGRGIGDNESFLLILEKLVAPENTEKELEKLLVKYPNYRGKLLVDIGAFLERDKVDGIFRVDLLEDQKGIWRLLESDYWMEAYRMGWGLSGGGGTYEVIIRNLAYEKERLAPIIPLLQALDASFRAGEI